VTWSSFDRTDSPTRDDMSDAATRPRTRPRLHATARVLAFVVAVALGLVVVWWLFSGEGRNFEAAGLGINTTTHEDSLHYGNRRIVCVSIDDLDRCLASLPPSESRKRILWLGWSQLYAINDYHAGDRTAPSLVAERLEPAGVDLIALAMPNINPREELLVYEYVRRRIRLGGLILPAWLQGMKQEGIRPTWQAALADPDVRAALASLPSGASILASIPVESKSAQDIAQSAPSEHVPTTQERVERRLTAGLGDMFPLWRVRGQAQGQIQLALLDGKRQLLRLRNLALGTRAEKWVNVVPPVRYAINMQAWTDLVGAARHDGLAVLVYVPPRPQGGQFPFDAALYGAFKAECERVAHASGADFANVEDSVADGLWGEIDNGAGEIVTDFNHFTAVGHAQMAGAVDKVLTATILPRLQ
jgi:hypothetical protein